MKLFIGNIYKDHAELTETESHHVIKVLRMNSGEEIYVTNGQGKLVKGNLDIQGKQVFVKINQNFPEKIKSENQLHIAMAPTKNIDRFEFFVEKAVELGISEITPLLTANSERKIIKIDKIQKQIENACKQSLQTNFPIINPLIGLEELMINLKSPVFIAHCYKEYPKTSVQKYLPYTGKITVLIGPEGDFSKKEVEMAYKHGALGIDLGINRLRTETAGIFVAAAYYYSLI